jgi:hypothetical protein
MHLVWDVGPTSGRGGVRLAWNDETGWSYAKLGTSAHDESSSKPPSRRCSCRRGGPGRLFGPVVPVHGWGLDRGSDPGLVEAVEAVAGTVGGQSFHPFNLK